MSKPTIETIAQELALFQIQVLKKFDKLEKKIKAQKPNKDSYKALLKRVNELEKENERQRNAWMKAKTEIEGKELKPQPQPQPSLFAKWFKRK